MLVWRSPFENLKDGFRLPLVAICLTAEFDPGSVMPRKFLPKPFFMGVRLSPLLDGLV
jgi:hypothetical protein